MVKVPCARLSSDINIASSWKAAPGPSGELTDPAVDVFRPSANEARSARNTYASDTAVTVGEYLLAALHCAGVHHIFGVPGDFIIRFYKQMENSTLIEHVPTAREDSAAFAADGYARCRGIGAVAVTYGPGALSACNAVAGAAAEGVSVIVISGAPATILQEHDVKVHHRFGSFAAQRKVFEAIGAGVTILDDAATAPAKIEAAITRSLVRRAPMYLELPQEIATMQLPGVLDCRQLHRQFAHAHAREDTSSDSIVAAAAGAAAAELCAAARPVILIGAEAHATDLSGTDVITAAVAAAKQLHAPLATLITGKGAIAERPVPHGYLGVFAGTLGSPEAAIAVAHADTVLVCGGSASETNLGYGTASRFGTSEATVITAAAGAVSFTDGQSFPRVRLSMFMPALLHALSASSGMDVLKSKGAAVQQEQLEGPTATRFGGEVQITTARLVARLNDVIQEDMALVVDVGDCLFASIGIQVRQAGSYLAAPHYASMGFAIPAALGASIARRDDHCIRGKGGGDITNAVRRAVVLVGDGAFQMTGTDIAAHASACLPTITVVLNNHGYSTERKILDGTFNNIPDWRYHCAGELLAGGIGGHEVHTEDEFAAAWSAALQETTAPTVINVQLPRGDTSEVLNHLSEALHADGKRGGSAQMKAVSTG